MADNGKQRQFNFRASPTTLQQIAELQAAYSALDPLSRPVAAADVIRQALDEAHQQWCRSIRGQKLLEKSRKKAPESS